MQHNLQIIMTSKKTVPLFADLQKTRVKFFFKMKITIGSLLFSAVVCGIKPLPPVAADKKISIQFLNNFSELSQIFDVFTFSTIAAGIKLLL